MSSRLIKQFLDCRDAANRATVPRLTRNPQVRWHALRLQSGVVIAAVLFAACNRTAPTVAGPLSQRGYLWQRDWTVAVNSTVLEAQKRMDGVILLGGEISWIAGNPEVVRTNINWQTLALS